MVTKPDSMKRGPAVPSGGSVHDSNEQNRLQQKLKRWLRKKSAVNRLEVFDPTDTCEVGSEGKSGQMTDCTIAQSRLFLEMPDLRS